MNNKIIKPLLTIAIPTFNRAEYLDICLNSIFNQKNVEFNQIELLVSDNASTDSTFSVVNKYKEKGLKVIYNCHETNIGLDANIQSCFSKANGKYFWCFGDDDLIIEDKMEFVLQILESGDYGMVFCNNYWFQDKGLIAVPNDTHSIIYEEFESKQEFIKKINYWVTFLTACIVNKDLILNTYNIDSSKYIGSNLNHVQWHLMSIFAGNKNIYVNKYIIACKSGNTGGYKLCQVFGYNFHLIMTDLIKLKILDCSSRRIIKKKLIEEFFPLLIYRNLGNKFTPENKLFVMMSVFGAYLAFWKTLFPIMLKTYIKGQTKYF